MKSMQVKSANVRKLRTPIEGRGEGVVRGCGEAYSINTEIAGALACTERTVESHVTALLRKLHAESRTELIAKVWSHEDPI